MLHFRVFAKRISRLLAVPSLSRIPVRRRPSPNSHGIISFADPHGLNSVSQRVGLACKLREKGLGQETVQLLRTTAKPRGLKRLMLRFSEHSREMPWRCRFCGFKKTC